MAMAIAIQTLYRMRVYNIFGIIILKNLPSIFTPENRAKRELKLLSRPSLLERDDASVAARNANLAAVKKVADAVAGASSGDRFDIYGADSDDDDGNDGGKSGESKSGSAGRSNANSRKSAQRSGSSGGLTRDQRSKVEDIMDIREQAVIGHKNKL